MFPLAARDRLELEVYGVLGWGTSWPAIDPNQSPVRNVGLQC